MVQIKKKVTLKAKTEQEPVVEPVQQTSAQPTLRKKQPVTEPETTITSTPIQDGNGNNGGGNGGSKKVIGVISAIVAVCALGYGAYSLFSNSNDDAEGTTTEQVVNATSKSNENETNAANNEDTVEKPETETSNGGDIANGEETTSPSQEESSSEASTPQAGAKQNSIDKPTEQSKEQNQAPKTAPQTAPTTQPVILSGTLEEMAMDVIRGNYGNGEVRKQKLGDQYSEIQSKVNEMYRNGLVK